KRPHLAERPPRALQDSVRGRQRPHHPARRLDPRRPEGLGHSRYPGQRRRCHRVLLRMGAGSPGLLLERKTGQRPPPGDHGRKLRRRRRVCPRPQSRQPHRRLHAGPGPRRPSHQTSRPLRLASWETAPSRSRLRLGLRHLIRTPPTPIRAATVRERFPLPMSDAATPLMRQYNHIKQQVPNALLMFRLGDFYELFFEDAVVAARELEITLTSRNKEKGAPIPMCGVPFHAAEGYISRLIQKGFRVAICDQVEDPKSAKGLVKREIMRVVTPGTAMDAGLVRSRENNFLAAVARHGSRSAVAHVDVSTGEFKVTDMDPAEGSGALEQLGAREVLFPTGLPLLTGDERPGPRFVRTELEDWVFTHDYADRTLRDHFKLLSLDGCGLAGRPAAVGAAGAILHYLRDSQRAALDHLDRPTYYDRADSMVLDAVTVRNLELLEPIFAAVPASGAAGGPQAQLTVLGVLDQTLTGMGGRLLRQRLLRPSMDRAEIDQRLDAVGELRQQTILRAELPKHLAAILDLERLLAKIPLGSASPRDVLALGRSLEKLPALKRCFDTQQAARLRNLHHRLDELADVASLILDAIADEPPLNLVDGGTIRAGYHAELDE